MVQRNSALQERVVDQFRELDGSDHCNVELGRLARHSLIVSDEDPRIEEQLVRIVVGGLEDGGDESRVRCTLVSIEVYQSGVTRFQRLHHISHSHQEARRVRPAVQRKRCLL